MKVGKWRNKAVICTCCGDMTTKLVKASDYGPWECEACGAENSCILGQISSATKKTKKKEN